MSISSGIENKGDQMRKVLRKLQSNKGATLMMALLFFVVCAVTGSMILVSATAASGRLEGMTEQDQNYYAVRSAVGFFEKTLCSEDTYIQATDKLEIKEGTKPDPNDPEKEIEYTIYNLDTPKLYIMDGTTNPPTKRKLTSGILFDLLTDDGIDEEHADDRVTNYIKKKEASGVSEYYPEEFNDKWFKGGKGSGYTGVFPDDESPYKTYIKKTVLSVHSNSGELESLKVDVSMYLDKAGILMIKCENHIDSENDNIGNTYSMLIKLDCNETIEMKTTETRDNRTKIREYSLKFKTLSIEKSK